MTMGEGNDRGRTSQALRALHEGEELARLRIWQRVRDGMEAERRRRRRRQWLTGGAGIVAACVAGIAVLAPGVFEQESAGGGKATAVSSDAVWEMLSAQPGADRGVASLQEFVMSVAPVDGKAQGAP